MEKYKYVIEVTNIRLFGAKSYKDAQKIIKGKHGNIEIYTQEEFKEIYGEMFK